MNLSTIGQKAVNKRNTQSTTLEQNQNSGPDLVVDRFDPIPSFPHAGEATYFEILVSNRGNGSAGSFEVQTVKAGEIIDRSRIEKLNAGQKKKLRIGPTKLYGPTVFEARVDTKNEIAETREDNNWMRAYMDVRNR